MATEGLSGKVLVEIVVCSVADAVEAEAGGADRLELCSAIELGGLTPSLGLLERVKRATSLPVIVMVRPRPGGFVYSEEELAVMRRDARLLVDAGADGLALGAVTTDGEVNAEALSRLPRAELCFHRAFDELRDPASGLGALSNLGFVRVLTSGGADTALDGADRMREFPSTLELVAAGGVRAANAAEVVRRSGVRQIHLGPFVDVPGTGRYGGYKRIDRGAVAAVVRALEGL